MMQVRNPCEGGAPQPTGLSPRTPAWAENQLEHLGACPLCKASGRSLSHSAVHDTLCETPGLWDLYTCQQCGLLYPDPRPDAVNIGKAYLVYGTHDESENQTAAPRNIKQQILRALQDNCRYHDLGIHGNRGIPGGRWLLKLMPHFHRSLLHDCRHLPLPHPGARLLDLGCGSGRFLDDATRLGWDARGLDPDPLAVAAGRGRGRQVEQGGLPEIALGDNQFDAVTMNHVVEHLHDPVAALRETHRILKPGGKVWVATPNTESASHRLFGPYWRGLEAPRHLAIFCSRALQQAFRDAGFVHMKLHKPKLVAGWYFESSRRLASKQAAKAPRSLKTRARIANLKARLWRTAGEELCMSAQKPEDT